MAEMNKTIRWLHLSDFHVGKDDYATRKMFDYILEHVRKRIEDKFIPDFIFLTGDLANKGLVSEYETFWLEFVAPLQEAIGGDIDQRTFAVPGNHDVDRRKQPAFSQDEITKPESRYLDPNEEGARLRGEMLIPRFRNYLDNDLTPIKGRLATTEGAFSEVVAIHGQQIGIVGINTAWLSKGDDDREKLTPGKSLLETALNNLKDANLRIVLGHHPIDWFIKNQQKSIKSLLGQHQVLYLHGHLHDAWAEPTYGGGQHFLAIQAGACFQAREREKWRNGLVWGEADMNAGEVRLQARHWIHDQQDWPLATEALHESHRKGDWWHYPLPGTQPSKPDNTPAPPAIAPPPGWVVYKPSDLAHHLSQLTPEAALRYFDGAVPDWSTALSVSIPRRGIVSRLVASYQNVEEANRPIVRLLLAAGCEGKTTVLLQAAYDITKSGGNWRILQRRNESQPLNPEAILPVLNTSHTWLLVLDEADHAAENLFELLKRLPQNHAVHALLACRDTDWRASNADNVSWNEVADFHKEPLRGVDTADAQAIVQAWQAYGNAGLGDLADKDEDQRAAILEQQAKEEAKTTSGALFGALLAVRSGSDLRNHARLLLERLGQRTIRNGRSLRDALAYIAAMHGEGLEFLSRPVLAQALGCPLEQLHHYVCCPWVRKRRPPRLHPSSTPAIDALRRRWCRCWRMSLGWT